MTTKFRNQFTEQEWRKLTKITNNLKEVSGDEELFSNPVFNNSSLEKVGGVILRYLLETLVHVVSMLEDKQKQVEYWRDKAGASREQGKDTAVQIAKACESVKEDDLRSCVNILGDLLNNEDELYI